MIPVINANYKTHSLKSPVVPSGVALVTRDAPPPRTTRNQFTLAISYNQQELLSHIKTKLLDDRVGYTAIIVHECIQLFRMRSDLRKHKPVRSHSHLFKRRLTQADNCETTYRFIMLSGTLLFTKRLSIYMVYGQR